MYTTNSKKGEIKRQEKKTKFNSIKMNFKSGFFDVHILMSSYSMNNVHIVLV